MLPLHPPPPPINPTEEFFRQWGIIHNAAAPASLPTNPQGKLTLSRTMFHAGKEHLCETIDAAIDPHAAPRKLIDHLRISYNEGFLRVLRSTKTTAHMGTWEECIARQIQTHIARYAYEREQAFPAMIAEQKKMNCLGATMLMGGMLEKLGVRYLQGYVTRHAILALLTADQRILWMDPLAPHTTEELRDTHLAHIRTPDIISFGQHPSPDGLAVPIAAEHFRAKVLGWTENREKPAILTLFPPEEGQHAMLLETTGIMLSRLQKYSVAAEALRLAVAELPGYANAHAHLGSALLCAGEREQGLAAHERARSVRAALPTPPPACRPPRPCG